MHRHSRYLSGLGDAEEALGVDEEATAPTPAGGPSWDTVLATTISALPEIAGKAAEVYHTYEEAHGHISHADPGGSIPAAGPYAQPARPWYESPGFLVITGLGLGIIVVIATRKK
jgi:hypothetical protein